jgi:DNA polymerase
VEFCVTGEQKTSLARFLDLAGDYLGDGYARPREALAFAGDVETAKAAAPEGGAENAPQTRQAAPGSVIYPEGDTLEGIAADARSCLSCGLARTRSNVVPGEGVDRPLVLVVGEGPGHDEDQSGRPFVGKAGLLLDKMLASIGLRREQNCFIANVVKCRPPENRDPAPDEAACCAPFLNRQIRCLKPTVILCVGRIATNFLLGNDGSEFSPMIGIGNLRGRFYEYHIENDAIPLLATYHPSALLRNEELKRPAWEDLKLLRAKYEELREKGPDNR